MDFLAMVLVRDMSLLGMACLGLLAAFVAVDDSSLAQTWFSQPLLAALLTGFFCGQPLVGLAIGLPLQLVLVGNLPVGQTFTGDPGVAIVATVAAACLSGRNFLPSFNESSFADLGLLGWAILVAGLLSALGHVVIQAERKAASLLMLQGHKTLRDGSLVRMEAIHLRCLATTFVRGFILGLLFLVFVLEVWLPVFQYLPVQIQKAMGMLPFLLPGLGVGTMIDRVGLKKSWPYLLGGLGFMLLLSWKVV